MAEPGGHAPRVPCRGCGRPVPYAERACPACGAKVPAEHDPAVRFAIALVHYGIRPLAAVLVIVWLARSCPGAGP